MNLYTLNNLYKSNFSKFSIYFFALFKKILSKNYSPSIIKTKLSDIKLLEKRPLNVSMNVNKLKKVINFKLISIEKIQKKYLQLTMYTKLKEDKKAKTKAFFFKKEDGVVFNLKLKNLMINYYKKKKKMLEFVCINLPWTNIMI